MSAKGGAFGLTGGVWPRSLGALSASIRAFSLFEFSRAFLNSASSATMAGPAQQAQLGALHGTTTTADLRIKPFRIRPRDKPGVVVRHVQREDRRRTVDLILPRHHKSQVSPLGPNKAQREEEL